jgi:hypothetical protein
LFSAVLGESTVYAKGYSERRFRAIQVAMTASEVEAILGPPLRQFAWGYLPLVWSYSDHPTDTDNFKRRWVAFKNGTAVKVINDFWID